MAILEAFIRAYQPYQRAVAQRDANEAQVAKLHAQLTRVASGTPSERTRAQARRLAEQMVRLIGRQTGMHRNVTRTLGRMQSALGTATAAMAPSRGGGGASRRGGGGGGGGGGGMEEEEMLMP